MFTDYALQMIQNYVHSLAISKLFDFFGRLNCLG